MMQVFAAVVAAYVYAVIAFPLLRIPGRFGRLLGICAALVELPCPLLIAADQMVLRAIAEFLCVDLWLKMIDYSRQFRAGDAGSSSFPAYLRFLPPIPVLSVVFGEREKRLADRLPVARELAIVGLTGCIAVGAFPAVEFASSIPALRACFPLNHAVKLAMFLVTIEAISRISWGVERLAGYNIAPLIDQCYLSKTPGEFWRRYNKRVGKWLFLNVFLPSGGRRAPIRGIFTAFFVSAALHEVAFAIATSRFTGYQFTFFMLQAPAVAVSGCLQPTIDRSGPALRTVSRCITILWFYFTSVFFFEGVNRIFPFVYGAQPWLPW
jgi:hypothetical protein